MFYSDYVDLLGQKVVNWTEPRARRTVFKGEDLDKSLLFQAEHDGDYEGLEMIEEFNENLPTMPSEAKCYKWKTVTQT